MRRQPAIPVLLEALSSLSRPEGLLGAMPCEAFVRPSGRYDACSVRGVPGEKEEPGSFEGSVLSVPSALTTLRIL